MNTKKQQTDSSVVKNTNTQESTFRVKRSVSSNIMIPYILITLLSVGVVSYVSIHHQSETLKNELIERNLLLSNQVCFAVKNAFYSLNWVYVQDFCKDMVEAKNVLWIYILTPDGGDYFSFVDSEAQGLKNLDHHNFKDNGSPERSYGINWIDSSTFSIFKPIEIGNETWFLCMGISIHSIDEMEKEIMHKVVLIAFFVTIIGCLLFVSFSKKLSNRIQKLVSATQDIARGKLDTEIQITAQDEIGHLSHNFNKMSRSLKHYSDELELSEEKFRTISSSAQDAIIMSTEDGIITYWNKSAQKIFGYEEQEIIGKEITSILLRQDFVETQNDTPVQHKNLEDCSDKGTTFETIATNRDMKEFPVEISVSAVMIKEERHTVVIVRDISQRKEAEMELMHYQEMLEQMVEERTQVLLNTVQDLKDTQVKLVQSEKLASIGQLAAGVAHEINNPMGFITSNLGSLRTYIEKFINFMEAQSEVIRSAGSKQENEYIESKNTTLKIDYIKEDIKDLIEESLEGAGRVKKIVMDLKRFSRVDDAEFQDTDINECIESTLNIVWNEIKYKAELKKKLGKIPLTKCYPQQINQVLMNLLLNAVQAIEEQGIIEIVSWQSNGNIYVSISDNGCGIPEENIEKLFNPFFTTKEVGKGTGLGLSISYDIIKNHKGEMTVESKLGQGTTFTVSLPFLKDEP